MPTTGVFPVHNNIFKVNTEGRTAPGTFVTIKDLETFSMSVDSKTEDWTPMDLEGWMRRAVTGKGLTISFKGKRNYGDAGNDYVAGLLLETGQGVESEFEWTLPNGDVFTMDCIIDLKSPAGGDSTNIDALEFDLLSDGLPVLTPAASALATLTFACAAGSAPGNTKVASVSPVLTGGNSYMYKLNGALPKYGDDLSAAGYTAYTLNADIECPIGTTVTIVEVAAGNLARKGGQAVAVVA
jgi:hypothetical protein